MRRTKPARAMRPRVGAAQLKLLTSSARLALHCNDPSSTLRPTMAFAAAVTGYPDKTIGSIYRRQEERIDMRNGLFRLATATTLAIALSASSAYAQKKYDTGATDTEIKIGQTNPFSGPASAYATIGKTQAAYIKMINDQGGINGRKVNLIQYDDAYSPP